MTADDVEEKDFVQKLNRMEGDLHTSVNKMGTAYKRTSQVNKTKVVWLQLWLPLSEDPSVLGFNVRSSTVFISGRNEGGGRWGGGGGLQDHVYACQTEGGGVATSRVVCMRARVCVRERGTRSLWLCCG